MAIHLLNAIFRHGNPKVNITNYEDNYSEIHLSADEVKESMVFNLVFNFGSLDSSKQPQHWHKSEDCVLIFTEKHHLDLHIFISKGNAENTEGIMDLLKSGELDDDLYRLLETGNDLPLRMKKAADKEPELLWRASLNN